MDTKKFEVPESFYEDEVRCGYFVSAKMKHVWAVQLEMLKELDRICEKHDLKYYADSGTLIGAIRHKGYIPWDDDIDVAMFRDDYQKLLRIADSEFKDPLFLQSVYSDVKYVRGLSRIRNRNTTAIDSADLHKPFNHGIFIDIFPLDNIPDNDLILKIWCRKIRFIRQLLRNWAYYESGKAKNPVESLVRYLLKSAVEKIGYKNVYKYLEHTCNRYNRKKTKRVSYVAYSFGKKKHIWKRSLYARSHKAPFEFMEINIPDGYDERLRVEYGDYMVMKNTPSTHGSVIFDPDIPYDEYIKTHDAEAEIMELRQKS